MPAQLTVLMIQSQIVLSSLSGTDSLIFNSTISHTSDMMLKTVFLEPSLDTFFKFVESLIHRDLITEIDLEINVLHLCQSS